MRPATTLTVGLLALFLVASCGSSDGDTGNAENCYNSADTDADGISDCDEGRAEDRNTDGDEWPDWRDLDSDGDYIPDSVEGTTDTDSDGIPDYLDDDSDGDGVLDIDESGADLDGDGIPDYLDDDSDGDGIPDSVEAPGDRDGDGLINSRDTDSDGDGIPDAIEAGDLPRIPRDSDSDGTPDYLDRDSDNDMVDDSDEDLNGNGILDPCMASVCESDPTLADTDGDGTPDLIERVAGSNPQDAGENIPAGDFFFVLPFEGDAQSGRFDFSTDVQIADVFFSVDTTGSFEDEIAEIQATLTNKIIPDVRAAIPDVSFGVGRFEDFPLEPYGLTSDLPYELLQPITSDITAISAGIDALPPAAGGFDIPEAGYEALYQWATGAGIPAFGYPAFAANGLSGAGFRKFALPIIVQITDARSHSTMDYLEFATNAHSRDQTVAALNAVGAKVIGIDSLENAGTPDDPRGELEDLAHSTDSVIPPDANGECLTGVGGAANSPQDLGAGLVCPLVFDVQPDGSGLGDLIVNAIVQLAALGELDISTGVVGFNTEITGQALPVGFTSADFINSVLPVAPAPAGSTIDGEIFRNVTPGSVVTFEVTAQNDFLPGLQDRDRLLQIDINVLGDGVTLLDVKRVFVIVPRGVGCTASTQCGPAEACIDSKCERIIQ
jgi:hypothetical protein